MRGALIVFSSFVAQINWVKFGKSNSWSHVIEVLLTVLKDQKKIKMITL